MINPDNFLASYLADPETQMTSAENDQLIASDYRMQQEDKMLLRALQNGELGSGPRIEEAIKKLSDRLILEPNPRRY